MADMDVFAAMGISGFGKAVKKAELNPSRFDKNKREEVGRYLIKLVAINQFSFLIGFTCSASLREKH
jgi:hypothetical protein